VKLTVAYNPEHGHRDHAAEALFVAQGLQRRGWDAETRGIDGLDVCVAVMAPEDERPDEAEAVRIGNALRTLTLQWLQIHSPAVEFQP
jgi:hypothetical protein